MTICFANVMLDKILTEAGYLDYQTIASPVYRWYLSDHLGDVRIVANASGAVSQTSHYAPYGEDIAVNNTVLNDPYQIPTTYLADENLFRFGGKEWNKAFSDYDFGARYHSTDHCRFSTMDPLAEKYFHLSPYAYCAGNPVRYVDPTGETIWIYDDNSKQYLKYQEEAFRFADGRAYDGDNNYINEIQSALSDLLSLGDEYISGIIQVLISSKELHRIVYNPNYRNSVRPYGPYGYSLANEGIPVGTHIMLNLRLDPIDGVDNNITSTLAHELMHSYDFNNGNLKGNAGESPSAKNIAEIRAVNVENRARVRLGMQIRRKYDDVYIQKEYLENPWRKKQLK